MWINPYKVYDEEGEVVFESDDEFASQMVQDVLNSTPDEGNIEFPSQFNFNV